VPAVALTSQADAGEQREILDGIRNGQYTLVYVAPERFRSPRFVDALRSIEHRLALIAIDEAHCISEWGHDFRPEYRRLGEVIQTFGAPRIACFTATATPEVRDDISQQLGLVDPKLHVRGFDRPNLTYSVVAAGGAEDKQGKLADLVRMREGGVALVYAATRKNAEKYAGALTRSGMKVRVYHAGLGDSAREETQDRFMAGKLDAIVATNAFGMGVDKSDIRLVVHADIPRSPEAYYQEAGRGGRDGKPTRCVLLFNAGDIRLQDFLIDASYPSAELMRGTWKLLRGTPELGRGSTEAVEAHLRELLPGEVSGASMSAIIRILERHGMLQRDELGLVAARPEPGVYPTLDVEGLQRRSDVERRKLKTMVSYAYNPRCRRQYMLAYFGDLDWTDGSRRCGACDNCIAVAHGRSSTLSDKETAAVRSLLLLVGALQGRFGRKRIAGIANATDDDDRFIELPERGSLRGWPTNTLLDLLRSLEGASMVETSRGEYPTLSTTRLGDLAAIGSHDLSSVTLSLASVTKKRPSKKSLPKRS
jgi:ATP-dependent DNA helicase RecQ